MATISLRVPEQELELIRKYAEINNCSLSEIIRNTMLEKIENEFDLQVFAEYEREKAAGEVRTYSHEEAWKELGL